jgi:hypothetical protein
VNKFGVATPVEPSSGSNETKVSDRNQVLAGNGKINGIDDLAPVPIDCQMDPTVAYQYRMAHGPNFIPPVQPPPCPGNLKAFAIDSLPNYGCICIVYNAGYIPGIQVPPEDHDAEWPPKETTSIWFKDRSCRFWYVAPDVTSYLRLMVVNLCIVGWWGAYSDSGMDPGSKLLMRRFAPERMVVNEAFGIRYNDCGGSGSGSGGGGGGSGSEMVHMGGVRVGGLTE